MVKRYTSYIVDLVANMIEGDREDMHPIGDTHPPYGYGYGCGYIWLWLLPWPHMAMAMAMATYGYGYGYGYIWLWPQNPRKGPHMRDRIYPPKTSPVCRAEGL